MGEETFEICRICRENENECPSGVFLSPCSCRGSTGLVHLHCLQTWVNTQSQRRDLRCEICHARYALQISKTCMFKWPNLSAMTLEQWLALTLAFILGTLAVFLFPGVLRMVPPPWSSKHLDSAVEKHILSVILWLVFVLLVLIIFVLIYLYHATVLLPILGHFLCFKIRRVLVFSNKAKYSSENVFVEPGDAA